MTPAADPHGWPELAALCWQIAGSLVLGFALVLGAVLAIRALERCAWRWLGEHWRGLLGIAFAAGSLALWNILADAAPWAAGLNP